MPECTCRGGNPHCFKCGGWGWIGSFAPSSTLKPSFTLKTASARKDKTASARKEPPQQKPHKITSDNVYGFLDKSSAIAQLGLISQKHSFTASWEPSANQDSKPDIVFTKGEVVFILDTDATQELVKIRRQGKLISYWTCLTAIIDINDEHA